MSFSFMKHANTRAQIDDAFQAMQLDSAAYPALYDLLFFETRPPLGYKHDAEKLSAWQRDATIRLEAIQQSILRAQAVCTKQPAILNDALLCAIASRDMDRGALKALRIFRFNPTKNPRGVAMARRIEDIQHPFIRVFSEARQRPHGYKTLGTEANQFLAQFHGYDYVMRLLYKFSNLQEPLDAFQYDACMENVARAHILLSDAEGPVVRQFNKHYEILQERFGNFLKVRPVNTDSRYEAWTPPVSNIRHAALLPVTLEETPARCAVIPIRPGVSG